MGVSTAPSQGGGVDMSLGGHMARSLGILVAVMIASGCSTHAAQRYAISADNLRALRALDTKSNVGPFTSSHPDLREIVCRAVGPIKRPDGEIFDEFIRTALLDELRSAGLFSERAPITLITILDEVESSSAPCTWNLSLTLNSSNGLSPTVKERSACPPSWNPYAACQQTGQALGPTVQKLIAALVRHPEFRRLID